MLIHLYTVGKPLGRELGRASTHLTHSRSYAATSLHRVETFKLRKPHLKFKYMFTSKYISYQEHISLKCCTAYRPKILKIVNKYATY